MLSPDGSGLSPKATAPSIWSFDSGYASNSLFEEELLQAQPTQSHGASSSEYSRHQAQETIGLGLGDFWNVHVGERLRVKREAPAIEPLVTKLNVFTTKDPSDNDFLLPEIPSEGETCLTCELFKFTNPGEDLRCEDCQIPEIVEPSALLLTNEHSKGKQPIPRLEIPQELQTKPPTGLHALTRCSACELSTLINPSGPSSCPSCSPNPALLSPTSPSSPNYRVKRSRAGRNTKLPLSALNRLQAWLDANQHDPYPSAETKRLLAQECGITEKQVTTWFTNARARQLNPLDTYLSSGSEDEAARESDIASAADTPTYTHGFSFISNTQQPPGYRRAGSVSGSSAFSTTQPRHQTSRRGKKKDYRRKNPISPTSPISEITSPIQPTSASTSKGENEPEMWQCTFCRRHLVPKSWRRHEETQHRPKAQWTCMLYGPRLSFPARSNSSSVCAFCMTKDPSEDHFLHHHRVSECAKRPIGDRTFYRPDHLRQHVKNFHSATLFDIVQTRWKRAGEGQSEEKGWTCGFCGEWLGTWDKRETHIANHFKDGMTMEQWIDYPEVTDKKAKDKPTKQDKKDHPHGLARLSRTFTRRSTRNSQSSSSSSHPQPPSQPHHNNTPFANAFASLPTPTTGLALPISDAHAPVLPDINMDPLMMDACGNLFDWTDPNTTTTLTTQYQQSQHPTYHTSFTTDAVFDPEIQATEMAAGFDTTALNMDLYGNPMDYQGPPWDQHSHQHPHQHQH